MFSEGAQKVEWSAQWKNKNNNKTMQGCHHMLPLLHLFNNRWNNAAQQFQSAT